MCRKDLEPVTPTCPRCRADLSLLVDYMSNLDEQLAKADASLKAGDLAESVWAYLNVLETDPANAVATQRIGRVAAAVRQFDRQKHGGSRWPAIVVVAVTATAMLLGLAAAFAVGYRLGAHSAIEAR
jgi:hypothetical protein